MSNPAATFNANVTSVCGLSTAINFSSQASSAISWNWLFGDGSTSIQQNPSHVYAQPGIYTVSLITSNQLGCSDTVIIDDYIEILANPVPSIQTSVPLSGCTPININFSTTTPNITTWSWNFGDTTASQLPSPSHAYYNAGVFPVSLNVTYANGCSNTNGVTVNASPRPAAVYQVQNNQGCAPLNVSFTNISAAPGNTYLWNFGDGTTSTQVSPSHIYNTSGTYVTDLTVTNVFRMLPAVFIRQ